MSFEFDALRADLGSINYKALTQTILAHSKKCDLMSIADVISKKIHLKTVCAIFRLVDVCDQNSKRVNKLLFKILVNENSLDVPTQQIWKAQLNVENVIIEKTTIKVIVHDTAIVKHCIDDLCAELGHASK